jgi:hypothetical protein
MSKKKGWTGPSQDKNFIPYIGETFAVLIGGKLHIVGDLLKYGPPTHAFYRYGRVWYLRTIEPLTDEELYFALEFTLAHDLPTLHITELR